MSSVPKLIKFSVSDLHDYDIFRVELENFHSVICKFDSINFTLKSHEDIEWIESFSEKFKVFRIFIHQEYYDNTDRD
jgi:hypothetical protein